MAFADLKMGGYSRLKPYILGILILIALILEIMVHWVYQVDVVYSHFFYIPVIVGAVWYGVRAVGIALFLGAVLIIGNLHVSGSVGTSAVARVVVFVVVALVIGLITDHMRKDRDRLINEVTDAALQSGISPAGILGNVGEFRSRVLSSANVKKMKSEGNVRGLISSLRNKDVGVQYEAAEALGELGDPAGVDPLIQALLEDQYSGIRWKAAEALAKTGEPAVLPLIGVLQDPDDDVRWKAAIALGEIGDVRAVGPLIEVLKDKDRFVKSRAAYALGLIGEPAVIPLMSAITKGDEDVRRGAAIALGTIGDPRSIPALIRAIGDPNESVKIEAISALSGMGEVVVAPLLEFLKYADDNERKEVVTALGELGDSDAIEPLMQMLETADEETRALIITALCEIGGPSVKTLVKGLKRNNQRISGDP
jgi:HEAT repeat protein